MKRKGLVYLAIGLIVLPPAIYLGSEAWADVVCDTTTLCSGTLAIDMGTDNGLLVEGTGLGEDYAPVRISQHSGAASPNYSAFVENDGTGNTSKYAVYGKASGDNGFKYGLFGEASGSNVNYGLKTTATGGTTAIGIDTMASAASTSNTGVYSQTTGSAAGYGVYSRAYGTGTNFGVYAVAQNGTSNTALYATVVGGAGLAGDFQGDVEVSGSVNVVYGLEVGGDITGTSSTSDITAGSSGNVTAGVSGNFRYTAARTFYYTVPSAVCVDTLSNTDDTVSRVYGYSYISYGDASPHAGYMNCPVKLPDGATVTRVDCGVRDSDDTGYVAFYLYRVDMQGSRVEMAYNTSGSAATPGDTTIYDSSISYATVDNSTYSYYLRANLVGSSYGSSYIRFNMCKITYTMQNVVP